MPRPRLRLQSAGSAALAALVLTACAAPGASPEPTAAPTDLFLLTVDALRADAAPPSTRGNEIAPFLASLAGGATVFPSAHATSSWTVPSAVTLVTGAYPHTHGITMGVQQRGKVLAQPVIPAQLPAVAELLRSSGYRTYAVLANGHLDARFGFARGFDRFSCPGFVAVDRVRDVLEPWLDEIAAGEGPFFLWVHLFDPHMPYHDREPWFRRYAPDVTGPELAVVERAKETWPRLPPEVVARPARFLDIARALYESEVSYVDAAVAELYGRLPVLDDALLLFTADHGEEFREHGALGHGNNLHAETVRVPLWVRPPGGGTGGGGTRVASLVDVPPTLLDAAGVEAPGWWPGRSLLSPAPGTPRPVLAQLNKFTSRRLEAIVSAGWKLILNPGQGTVRLYDLDSDPWERRDLAAARPDLVAKLRTELDGLVAAQPPAHEVATAPVEPATAEALRELGYVE